ncbi:MAG: creatininase family protein [Deltaproteobacteria bacterium]|nr:creatininase family protein [Deltaproteobacteria bacterium]
MPPADTAARGRALLAERMAATPDRVAAVPDRLPELLTRPTRLPRALITTGIGTSEGHARHLAELAARRFGWPARFASTGSLAEGPPPGAERDWLVVFSQGLSANARHALRHVEAYRGVVLVTGLSPDDPDPAAVSVEKRAWLAALERRGVVRIELGCGPEYGALLRVMGARVGYAVAWSLLRTLAHRRLEDPSTLAIERPALLCAQRAAVDEADRVLPRHERVAAFFAPERTLLLVGEAGALELVDHLALKLAEGMLRPQPRAIDVLHFAHGPLQSLARTPVSILYLQPGPPRAAGDDSPWLARLAATLDPALHDLRAVRTALPMPFAAIELEAIFDAWILRHQDETGLDLVAWPGAERERALYDAGPPLEAAPVPPVGIDDARPSSAALLDPAAHPIRLEQATWPELERTLEAGHRTAIVALGSIEQHGPHLPLATDRWIADALACRLAARVGDAVALPALPFGCASEHLDFPGTLHIEPATLEACLRDLLASLARHGFARAFLFTAHGGNHDALRAMGPRLAEGARPLVLALGDGLDVGRLQEAVVAAHGLAPRAAGPHAGEYETSVVAWLRPGAVRGEALASGPLVVAGSGSELFHPSLRPNAPEGVLGDPTRATGGRGEAYLEAWVDALERAYRGAFASVAEKNRNDTKGTQKA